MASPSPSLILKVGPTSLNLLQETIQIGTTVCGFKARRNLSYVLVQRYIKYINSNYRVKRNFKNEWYLLIKLNVSEWFFP